MEKMESAQPLWITLALQKQKGFREQQATREERRQAREAKQAEKLAKENVRREKHVCVRLVCFLKANRATRQGLITNMKKFVLLSAVFRLDKKCPDS